MARTADLTVVGTVTAVTGRRSDEVIGSLGTAVAATARHIRLEAATGPPTRLEPAATGPIPLGRGSTEAAPMRAACRFVSTHAASAR